MTLMLAPCSNTNAPGYSLLFFRRSQSAFEEILVEFPGLKANMPRDGAVNGRAGRLISPCVAARLIFHFDAGRRTPGSRRVTRPARIEQFDGHLAELRDESAKRPS